MASDLLAIEQGAQVSAELANDYMIASLSQVAGIPGGAELQDDVVGLMGSLGVELAPVEYETGFLGVAAVALRAGLAKSASKGAAVLAKNPAKWGIALGIAAGGVALAAGSYEWMTADQQIELEKIRQSSALQAKALEGLSPAQKLQVAQGLAAQTFAPPPSPLLPWLALGAALGLGYWFYVRKR